jgi:hypothetical protein
VADRLAFVRPPSDLANAAQSADAFDAGLIVLDYIQRVGTPGEHGDRRGAVGQTMEYLRQFADTGLRLSSSPPWHARKLLRGVELCRWAEPGELS